MGLRAKVVAATPLITVIIYLLLASRMGCIFSHSYCTNYFRYSNIWGTVSRFSRYSIFSDGTCLGNMASGMDYIFNNTSR